MNELTHWGIKGQKWGVRRYQNPDGTLTEAGKKRYEKGYEINRRHNRELRKDLARVMSNDKKFQKKAYKYGEKLDKESDIVSQLFDKRDESIKANDDKKASKYLNKADKADTKLARKVEKAYSKMEKLSKKANSNYNKAIDDISEAVKKVGKEKTIVALAKISSDLSLRGYGMWTDKNKLREYARLSGVLLYDSKNGKINRYDTRELFD